MQQIAVKARQGQAKIIIIKEPQHRPTSLSVGLRFKGCYAFQGKPRFALKGVATFESYQE